MKARLPSLRWRESGHSQVAHVGGLRLVVHRIPLDGRWRVSEVFGENFAVNNAFFPTCADAQVAAEKAAKRYARQVYRALVK